MPCVIEFIGGNHLTVEQTLDEVAALLQHRTDELVEMQVAGGGRAMVRRSAVAYVSEPAAGERAVPDPAG